MIGELRSFVLDCPQPAQLARFYAELVGAEPVTDGDDEDWVTIVDAAGRRISFQQSSDYQPPRFPDPHGSQQIHLDVLVTDVAEAERAVLAAGARRLDGEGGDEKEGFRVYADPVGHPFCLVWQ